MKGNVIFKIVHALENASSNPSQSKWEVSLTSKCWHRCQSQTPPWWYGPCNWSWWGQFLMFQFLNWSYAQLCYTCIDVHDRCAGLSLWSQQTTSLPNVDLTALAGNASHAWSLQSGKRYLEITVGGRLTDKCLTMPETEPQSPALWLVTTLIDWPHILQKNTFIRSKVLKMHNCNTHICDVLPSVPL